MYNVNAKAFSQLKTATHWIKRFFFITDTQKLCFGSYKRRPLKSVTIFSSFWIAAGLHLGATALSSNVQVILRHFR
jgi:hypothetical protein